jgi:signal transduction histidine kinase
LNSLQQRLQVGLASSVVLLMLLLWWLVGGAMEKFGEEFVQSRLVHDADSLLSALQTNEADELQLTPGRMAGIYQKPFSGHYFVVLTKNKTLYSRSLWDETLSASPLAQGETRQWLVTGPSQQPLLVWSGGFQKQGQQFTIAVAEDLSALKASMVRFNWYFAGLSFVVLLVLLAVQQYIVRRSFVPLQQIQQEIKNLQQGAVGELAENVPSEVQPLVREVNHLLQLLSERLKRSRNAMGNLAHALKAPLSLLTQISRQESVRALPELSADLKKYTDAIQQLMDRELKRARLMGQGAPGARFSPQEEMPVLVDVLQRMFAVDNERTQALDIQWQAPDVAFMFDRDDMLELIGNLLDNACKWAKQEVHCDLQGDDHHLQLVVEDDGPGCDDDEIKRLTERGVRIDEAAPGHGLGLAIVRDVVEIYGGELVLGRSEALGGLRVCVRLEDRAANKVNGSS